MKSLSDSDWLLREINSLTDTCVTLKPSEWAEQNRRLSPSVTSKPGPFSFKVAPFMREPLDNMDVNSDIRETIFMKGVQCTYTVSMLENAIGYAISQVKTAPCMMVTATQDLAKMRMDSYIVPMIEDSGLLKDVQNISSNSRKAATTATQLNMRGGGWLVVTGSDSPAKARSLSIRNLYIDECDVFPITLRDDGDPMLLFRARTNGFESTRKILIGSTPNTLSQSRIAKAFKTGDQRRYFVPCLDCGEPFVMRWEHTDEDGKFKGGVTWVREKGLIVPGSVRYACPHCGHLHINSDKTKMLETGGGAMWVPTAIPTHPTIRSYHAPATLSPPGFFSWESGARQWNECWNMDTRQCRDTNLLRVFMNNVLGEPYDDMGDRLTLGKVGRHLRQYKFGEIPNKFALAMTGAKISFLTLTADVHDDFISVGVVAHAVGRTTYLIDRQRFDGSTEDPHAKTGPWAELYKMIARKTYNDGVDRIYPITMSLIDSGYLSDVVYQFCLRFPARVYAVKGDPKATAGAAKEFLQIKNLGVAGVEGFRVNVNAYKNHISAMLKLDPQQSDQPCVAGSVSFPSDIPDDAMKELTAEQRVQILDKNGNPSWVWKRKGRNELWDTSVYNSAARDIFAWKIMKEYLEQEQVVWSVFWTLMEERRLGFKVDPTIGA